MTELDPRFEKVRRILHRVLDLPADQRMAQLDLLCHGDVDLRREVEGFLRADDDACDAGFLEEANITTDIGVNEPKTQIFATGRPPQVVCPNCRTSHELALVEESESFECRSCGESFRLVDRDADTKEANAVSNVGHFQLIERLGAGGFGTVWKARDTVLERTVAVKIPRSMQFTNEDEEKFIREARAAAQLNHPNIVAIHEVGREAGSIYIVSDFVRGVPLSELLNDQPIARTEACQMMIAICGAVQHAHRAGVIHRDLKPQNIMLDGKRNPLVMDFGLAKREADDISMTLDGQVFGTPAYMSPEQAAGFGNKADRRSDVYSLGVILFQLLTRELPFRGTTRMLIHKVINEEPPSPRSLDKTISKDLETICLKCHEKDPEKRYDSAQALADDLQRHLDGQVISARPIGPLPKAWRWAKRNPGIVGIASAVIIGLLTVTGVFAVMNSQLNTSNRELAVQTQQAESARDKARQSAESERAARKEEEKAKDEAIIAKEKAEAAQKVAVEARTDTDRVLTFSIDMAAELLVVVHDAAKTDSTFQELRRNILAEITKLIDDRIEKIEKNPVSGQTNAGILQRFGDLLIRIGDLSGALESYQRANETIEQVMQDNLKSETLFSERARTIRNMAIISNKAARATFRFGGAKNSLPYYQNAVEKRTLFLEEVEKEQAADSTKRHTGTLDRARLDLANVYAELANCRFALGRTQDALSARTKAAANHQNISIAAARRIQAYKDKQAMALLRLDLGETKTANDLATEVLADARAIHGSDDVETLKSGQRVDLANANTTLGDCLLIGKKDALAAAKHYHAAYRLLKSSTGDDKKKLAGVEYRLAVALTQIDENGRSELGFDEPKSLLLSARETFRVGARNPFDTVSFLKLALTDARLGKTDEAISFAESFEERAPDDLRMLFQTACIYSCAAETVAGEAEKKRLIEKGLNQIRRLVAAGWQAPFRLVSDPDLQLLQQQEGFRLLLPDSLSN